MIDIKTVEAIVGSPRICITVAPVLRMEFLSRPLQFLTGNILLLFESVYDFLHLESLQKSKLSR